MIPHEENKQESVTIKEIGIGGEFVYNGVKYTRLVSSFDSPYIHAVEGFKLHRFSPNMKVQKYAT